MLLMRDRVADSHLAIPHIGARRMLDDQVGIRFQIHIATAALALACIFIHRLAKSPSFLSMAIILPMRLSSYEDV